MSQGHGRAPARTRRPLVATLALGLTAIHRSVRVAGSATLFLEGLALTGLTADELSALTGLCYRMNPGAPRQALFPWEARWLQRDLPAPPARVLVGGAGDGRELGHLRALGYDTVAFDPVARAGAGIHRARYEDLLDARGGGAPVAAVRAGAPYQAALLGWGSFTHVPGADRRLDVLRALRCLCQGPLLLSYWSAPAEHGELQSRARDLGRRIGRALRRGDALAEGAGDRLAAHCGYVHRFQQRELEELASEAGYHATCHPLPYPHATLVRADQPPGRPPR